MHCSREFPVWQTPGLDLLRFDMQLFLGYFRLLEAEGYNYFFSWTPEVVVNFFLLYNSPSLALGKLKNCKWYLHNDLLRNS